MSEYYLLNIKHIVLENALGNSPLKPQKTSAIMFTLLTTF